MNNIKKIVIAGGSGFLGGLLIKHFEALGVEMVVLSRQGAQRGFSQAVAWDGKTLGEWKDEIDGADVLINLAGKSVNCRFTTRNKRLLKDSRILSTRVLGKAVSMCTAPPKIWMNASSATIYEHTYGPPYGEGGRICGSPDANDEFSVELIKEWEREFDLAQCPNTRKIALRISLVFDRAPGTVYSVLKRLVRFGLGGKMGHGKQFVSWIHAEDFCCAVQWLIQRDEINGAVNIASPLDLTNSEMMRALRKIWGMPFGLPATKGMLEIGTFLLRTESELVIKSRRAKPEKLITSGFNFAHPIFENAIRTLAITMFAIM